MSPPEGRAPLKGHLRLMCVCFSHRCRRRGGFRGAWVFGLGSAVIQTTLGSDPQEEEHPVSQRRQALYAGDLRPGGGSSPHLFSPQRYVHLCPSTFSLFASFTEALISLSSQSDDLKGVKGHTEPDAAASLRRRAFRALYPLTGLCVCQCVRRPCGRPSRSSGTGYRSRMSTRTGWAAAWTAPPASQTSAASSANQRSTPDSSRAYVQLSMLTLISFGSLGSFFLC